MSRSTLSLSLELPELTKWSTLCSRLISKSASHHLLSTQISIPASRHMQCHRAFSSRSIITSSMCTVFCFHTYAYWWASISSPEWVSSTFPHTARSSVHRQGDMKIRLCSRPYMRGFWSSGHPSTHIAARSRSISSSCWWCTTSEHVAPQPTAAECLKHVGLYYDKSHDNTAHCSTNWFILCSGICCCRNVRNYDVVWMLWYIRMSTLLFNITIVILNTDIIIYKENTMPGIYPSRISPKRGEVESFDMQGQVSCTT